MERRSESAQSIRETVCSRALVLGGPDSREAKLEGSPASAVYSWVSIPAPRYSLV